MRRCRPGAGTDEGMVQMNGVEALVSLLQARRLMIAALAMLDTAGAAEPAAHLDLSIHKLDALLVMQGAAPSAQD